MLSKEEIKKWILENCMSDEGRIDLSDLDFSDVKADVFISSMIVNGNLFQDWQTVCGDLLQGTQYVRGELDQRDSTADGDIRQERQTCGGAIIQDDQWCPQYIQSGRKMLRSIEEENEKRQGLQEHLEEMFHDFNREENVI